MGSSLCSNRIFLDHLNCVRVEGNGRNSFADGILRKKLFSNGVFFILQKLHKGYKVVHMSDHTTFVSGICASWCQVYV